MNKKLSLWFGFLIFFLVLMNVAIFFQYHPDFKQASSMPTAQVVNLPDDKGFIADEYEKLEINKTDLTACCNFTFNNSIHTCYILNRFNCSVCDYYCKQ